jgi:hypothetical protein
MFSRRYRRLWWVVICVAVAVLWAAVVWVLVR